MNDAKVLRQAVETQAEWMVRALRALVETESPSDDKAAVDAAVRLTAGFAEACGGRFKLHKQKHFGDVLEVRFGPASRSRKPVLLLGHLDTVWPLGTLKTMPWRERDGRYFGPGVLDMKSGVAMALAAIRALEQPGSLRPVTLLLNSDEEVGSPVSRPITERLALASSAVLVLEPAQGLACKTARKGVGDYHLHVTGVAAHSGVDFERGHSAILELARLLETVAGFTDLRVGRTVNPGVISGGTRSNVIAGHAYADVDVRIAQGRATRRGWRNCFAGCAAPIRRASWRLPAGLTVRRWSASQARSRFTSRRASWPRNLASRSTKRRPAAVPTATLPPRWVCPRSTAWARWAKARTRRTSRW